MIADKAVLAEIQESWKGVEMLRQKVHVPIRVPIFGYVLQGIEVLFAADAEHNLPFVHACAVLNDALKQLEREGRFNCNSIFLGALLSASKDKLPWKDFTVIEEAVKRRNGIAHHGEIVPREDCWRFTDAIKDELVSFRILQAG